MAYYTDADLDQMFADGLLCDICETQPWTQDARWHAARVCATCAEHEPAPDTTADTATPHAFYTMDNTVGIPQAQLDAWNADLTEAIALAGLAPYTEDWYACIKRHTDERAHR